jgi:hypothetical protein
MPEAVQSFTLVNVAGGAPLLGHLRAFKPASVGSCRRQHGDALRFRLGSKTLYLFSHPDLAEEILVQQSDRCVKGYDPGGRSASRWSWAQIYMD